MRVLDFDLIEILGVHELSGGLGRHSECRGSVAFPLDVIRVLGYNSFVHEIEVGVAVGFQLEKVLARVSHFDHTLDTHREV